MLTKEKSSQKRNSVKKARQCRAFLTLFYILKYKSLVICIVAVHY